MESGGVQQGNWTESFHQYQKEILEKMKKGQTEDAIPTGACEMTQTEWNKIMQHVDKQLEEIKEEQEERLSKRQEQEDKESLLEGKTEAARLYEASARQGSLAEKLLEAEAAL